MVKTLNIAFEDNDHNKLVKAKGKKSWHDFFMELVK